MKLIIPVSAAALRPLALCALVALAACSKDSSTGPDPVQQQDKADVAAELNSIPAWSQISPPVTESQNQEEGDPDGQPSLLSDSDSRYSPSRVCTTTPYSLGKNPDQIVTMSPDQGLLVPGVLLQGHSHVLGSLQQLQIAQRAPIDLVINKTGVGNPSVTVEHPSLSSLQTAVNQLIQDAETSGFAYGSDVSFHEVFSHSSEQAALGLGLSARYLGASASSSLKSQTSAEENTVTASFIQNAFSIRADGPSFAQDWFSDDFTQDMLQQYIDSGQIGEDNPPLVVLEVTYGRIVVVNFTSSASRSDIEGFFQAGYENRVGSVKGRISAAQEQMIRNASIQVVSLGGPAAGGFQFAKEILSPDDPSTVGLDGFFAQDVALTTFKPISYVIADLRTGQVARVGETTQYDVLECADRVESTWDGRVNNSSVDGWTAIGQSFLINDPAPDTKAGDGSLAVREGTNGMTWLYAPAKFLGDKSAYSGGRLTYWTKWRGPTQAASSPIDSKVNPDVQIESSESTNILVYSSGYDDFPADTYVKRTLTFAPSEGLRAYSPTNGETIADAHPATQQEIDDVLADISRITVAGELRAGGGVWDTVWIDEFKFIPAFVPEDPAGG